MPPQKAPSAKPDFQMPKAPAIVLWLNAPGAEPNYAIVTKYGRNAISVMIFPAESRVGVPRDGVRHVSDPWNAKNGVNEEAGVWDYTPEHLQFEALKATVLGLTTPTGPLPR